MKQPDSATPRSHQTPNRVYADGRLYVRGHTNGDVVLVEASGNGYKEHGRLTQPDRSSTPAWPHPVVSNGGLFLCDQETLLCYDVTAK
jgi:hypothetical protein